ncbi:MAG: hypothetical protein IJG13_06545 [Kiritimatiellae bacterium]|nr:hypothetical protein [Kiritimatiellia bacterium]MBQ6327527.1 hypothetical protein [Kiritimatiellia bacterium]
MMVRCAYVVLYVGCGGLAAFGGNSCLWIGDSGSGSWDDAAHWAGGTKPVGGNGDTVTISNDVVAAEITVPANISIGNMLIIGSESVHLKGAKISLSGSLDVKRFCTIDNALDFTGNNARLSPGRGASAGGTTVFNGTITLPGWMTFWLGGFSDAVFNGAINGQNTPVRSSAEMGTSGKMYFNNTVKFKSILFKDTVSRCNYVFNAGGNEWQTSDIALANISCGCENALSANGVLTWNHYYCEWESNSSYYLNGYNQVANRISSEKPSKDVDYISTTNTASLLLVGTDNAETYSCTRGDLTILWAPTDDYTQAFLGRDHKTTGRLVVSNGTLRVGGTATFKSVPAVEVAGGRFLVDTTAADSMSGVRRVEVASGATFEVSTDAAPLMDSAVDFVLESNSRLIFPAGTVLRVNSLTVDGEPLQPGRVYDSENCQATIIGCKLFVLDAEKPSVAMTWTGEGAPDASEALASNWGGACPNLFDGSLVATFAQGGQAAMVTGDDYWKGIVFGGTAANEFALTAAAGGNLTLRNAGIAQGTALTNSIAVPLALNVDQTWSIGAGSLLSVSDAVACQGGAITLTKSGAGMLELSGDNALCGDLKVSEGVLRLVGSTNCLGRASDEGTVIVDQNAGNALLKLACNGVVERKVEVKSKFAEGGIRLEAGVTNVFMRNVKTTSDSRFVLDAKACLVFAGGLTATAGYFGPSGINSELIIRDEPVNMYYLYLSNPLIRLQVSGNTFTTIELREYGRLTIEADDVFANLPTVRCYAGSAALMDLSGHDVEVGDLGVCNGGEIVSLSGPATLTFNQTGAAQTNALTKMGGELSLCKKGAKLFALNREIASTGTLEVAEGELAMLENAAWLGCTGVVVRAEAKLTLASSARPFDKMVDVLIETGGELALLQGWRQPVGSLTVGGERLVSGDYGSLDGPAPNKLSCITGSGVLHVRGGGITLIVR